MSATAPDYLTLPVTWSPSRQFAHGQTYEYRLALRDGDEAIVRSVAGKGWALTIAQPGKEESERGLFVTLSDALMVVYAEYYPQLVCPGAE